MCRWNLTSCVCGHIDFINPHSQIPDCMPCMAVLDHQPCPHKTIDALDLPYEHVKMGLFNCPVTRQCSNLDHDDSPQHQLRGYQFSVSLFEKKIADLTSRIANAERNLRERWNDAQLRTKFEVHGLAVKIVREGQGQEAQPLAGHIATYKTQLEELSMTVSIAAPACWDNAAYRSDLATEIIELYCKLANGASSIERLLEGLERLAIQMRHSSPPRGSSTSSRSHSISSSRSPSMSIPHQPQPLRVDTLSSTLSTTAAEFTPATAVNADAQGYIDESGLFVPFAPASAIVAPAVPVGYYDGTGLFVPPTAIIPSSGEANSATVEEKTGNDFLDTDFDALEDELLESMHK